MWFCFKAGNRERGTGNGGCRSALLRPLNAAAARAICPFPIPCCPDSLSAAHRGAIR